MTKTKKTNRTQIKDLAVNEQELTGQEMEKVQGGAVQTDLAGGVTGAQASLRSATGLPTTSTNNQGVLGWKPKADDPKGF